MKYTPLPKGFTLLKSSNRIQYRCTINGVRHCYYCTHDPRTDPVESYEEIRQWKESILHPELKSVITVPSFAKNHIDLSMTLKDALLQYIEHYANIDHNYGSKSRRIIRPSDETIRVAKTTAILIGRYPLGKTKLYDLNEGIIQDFFYDLADKYTFIKQGVEYHYSKTTSDKTFALVKNFMYEMGWERILFSNVKKAIHNSDIDTFHLRDERPENNYLSDDELKRFLLTLETTKHEGRGVKLDITDAILVMYDLALRPAEVRGLQKKDYDAENKTLFVRRSIPKSSKEKVKETKTKDQSILYLSDKAAAAVEKHLQDCLSDDDYLFKSTDESPLSKSQHKPISYLRLYRGIKRIAKEAGITNKSVFPYLTRHTQITQTYAWSNNIEMAQQVARHKRATTTLTYYIHSNSDLAKQSRDLKNKFYAQ